MGNQRTSSPVHQARVHPGGRPGESCEKDSGSGACACPVSGSRFRAVRWGEGRRPGETGWWEIHRRMGRKVATAHPRSGVGRRGERRAQPGMLPVQTRYQDLGPTPSRTRFCPVDLPYHSFQSTTCDDPPTPGFEGAAGPHAAGFCPVRAQDRRGSRPGMGRLGETRSGRGWGDQAEGRAAFSRARRESMAPGSYLPAGQGQWRRSPSWRGMMCQ